VGRDEGSVVAVDRYLRRGAIDTVRRGRKGVERRGKERKGRRGKKGQQECT
jgi:hypothetical protein